MTPAIPVPVLVTPPAAPVVTTDEVKAHLSVTHGHHDTMIDGLRDSAIAYLDGWHGVLGRAIMPQTWAQEFTGWGNLRLALPDVSAITVTAFDAGDNPVTPASAVLSLDHGGPYVVADGPAASRIRVQYTCGLPPALLPAARTLVLMMTGAWYETRESIVVGASVVPVPMAADALIAALRWRSA